MFQLPRKAKEVFHGHLTRFKFEELIDVKKIGMFIFIFCSEVFLYGCLCNQRNVLSKVSVMFDHRTTSYAITIKKRLRCHSVANFGLRSISF